MSDDIIRTGKVVFITYSVLSESGQIMGQQDMPTGYVQGAGSGLFAPIERGLEGHEVGERVEIGIPPEEGFGPHDPALTIVEDLANVPPDMCRLGAEAEFQNENGNVLTFRVTRIEEGRITLDGNHPLAGQTTTCVVDVVSVRDATPQEMETGFPLEQGPPPMH